jgi:uncharacterized protein YraI
MSPFCRRTFFVLAIAALPAAAFAEDAFTLQQTDIFAGPSSEFPQIASLPPNTEVGVAGCLSDWSWCDVTFANDRGWVWAGDLGYPYQNDRVAIIEYGPRLRLPVVVFSINTYWDAHYRSRPFFRERDVWVSRVHVEGSHGGAPPHGGTRVARPAGGAQPGQAPSGQAAQPQQAQPTQGMQRREEGAQRQGDQRTREEEARKTEQRSPQQAQRAQPNQAQPTEGTRPQEDVAKSPQRRAPEASRAPESEQRTQSSAQRTQPNEQRTQSMEQSAQERAPQREAGQSASRPEAMRGEPDRGASAKGPQERPEAAARGEPDRGANAKGPQRERGKEEGRDNREGNQQQ